jgi:hypothetical protein
MHECENSNYIQGKTNTPTRDELTSTNPCKHCGACDHHERCDHCGYCRKCGKYVGYLPYYPPYYPRPYYPYYPYTYNPCIARPQTQWNNAVVSGLHSTVGTGVANFPRSLHSSKGF